jgi:hypothetical protein
MYGQNWSDYELAVIVYFRSRGISQHGCLKMLNAKVAYPPGSQRTLIGVRHKLKEVGRDFPGWDSPLRTIDHWLSYLVVPNLPAFLSLNATELEMLGKVTP